MSASQVSLFLCAICHKPVELETAKTNSRGESIHEDCYVILMVEDGTPSPDEGTSYFPVQNACSAKPQQAG